MAKNIPLTEFDLITLNPLMQVVKAVIPFFDLKTQKTFSFMIRFYEFQQTMQFFNSSNGQNPFAGHTNCSSTPIRSLNDIISNDEILDTIIKYCPENYASIISSYRQFSKMSQMYDIFNATTETSEKNANPLNDLSSLFSGANPFQTFSNTSDKKSDGINTSFMNNIMDEKQQSMYEQYMKELDNLDFNNINL